MNTVLVTGGSGFVGGHAIVQLLAGGHQVRATLRSMSKADEVRKAIVLGGQEPDARLSFAIADLENDEGWREAAEGCDYVLHVASPFAVAGAKSDDDYIIPARDGALRVLRAARNERVKRVVLTSSFGAVGYGHKQQKAPFDETNWTNVDAKGAAAQSVSAYIKSKTLAERAAWDFIAKEGDGLELAVVNPTGIFGPVLGSQLSGSVQIIQRLLKGAIPACPPLHFAVADVRDVADVHIRAMTHPEANGQRFLVLSGEPISMLQASLILKARLGDAAAKAPTKELSPLLLRIAAPFNPAARQALAGIGPVRRASNAKARCVLGWTPRSTEDAVTATGESLIRLGLV